MSWFILLSFACVLDRTGQSASNQMVREMRDNGVRIYNVEQQFVQVEARVNQLEDLIRTRGQEKISQIETLEQVREQMGRLRGEVEVLSHAAGQGAKDMSATVDDARFRVLWLEVRADQLERSLGLSTPDPPAIVVPVVDEPSEGGSTWSAADGVEAPLGTGGAAVAAVAVAPVAVPQAPAASVPDPVTTPTLDPLALLEKAKAQLKEGNHVGAETLLGRFLEAHPNHSRADEATYRRAEAAKVAEDYENAVLRYQEVIDQFNGSAFAPWAMFRQGECFKAQGQEANAKVFYGEVIRIYPKSRAARSARKQLGK
jgi:tol-pal system protein YbgF